MPKKPKPGGSVFEPRSRLSPAGGFGKVSIPLAPVGEQDAQFDAAQFQHLISNAVRECVLAQHDSLRSFVETLKAEPTMSYERLSRILRGETMMTMTDLLIWCSQFELVAALVARLVATDRVNAA